MELRVGGLMTKPWPVTSSTWTRTAAAQASASISILDAVSPEDFMQALYVALPNLSAAAPAENNEAARAALAEEGNDMHKSLVQYIFRGNDGRIIVRISIPSVGYLYALRDKLLEESFEQMLNQELYTSASKGKMLKKNDVKWQCDRKSFVSIYQNVLAQLDALTPHQQSKYEQCLKHPKVHIMGIAGSGKTFLALAVILHHLLEADDNAPVLFISRNRAVRVPCRPVLCNGTKPRRCVLDRRHLGPRWRRGDQVHKAKTNA